jgi:prepilin-type N-terminal cleavage/methylation domain-containing protein
MPTKGNYSALTLIEILVVIAVLGILAAFVTPNISGWNCRQEIRNDFERINGFLETVRLEAVNRNKTMMAHYNRNGFFRAYQVSKSCQINTSIVSTDIPDLILNKKDIIPRGSDKFRTCFNADGTSYGGQFTITRQCDGKNYQLKSKIFGATGFIEKLKYNLTTSKWDEL